MYRRENDLIRVEPNTYCADIIQPKHLPSALLYLSIVLFWLLSHLCLLYCSESEIDYSHLSFTSINVVQFYWESHWAYQHQFVPEGTCSLGVCCCGGVQVRDAWPGGYSAICDDLWPDEILQAGVTHKGRSTHTMTGMIGRWCFLSSQPKPPVSRSYY